MTVTPQFSWFLLDGFVYIFYELNSNKKETFQMCKIFHIESLKTEQFYTVTFTNNTVKKMLPFARDEFNEQQKQYYNFDVVRTDVSWLIELMDTTVFNIYIGLIRKKSERFDKWVAGK